VRKNGLIVALWKFDVLKSSIFALEASLLVQIFDPIKNIKFLRGNYISSVQHPLQLSRDSILQLII